MVPLTLPFPSLASWLLDITFLAATPPHSFIQGLPWSGQLSGSGVGYCGSAIWGPSSHWSSLSLRVFLKRNKRQIRVQLIFSNLQYKSCLLVRYVKQFEPFRLSFLEADHIQLTCTITTLSASECELTDIACIKANKPLQDELSVCVRASCTIKESLSRANSTCSQLE